MKLSVRRIQIINSFLFSQLFGTNGFRTVSRAHKDGLKPTFIYLGFVNLCLDELKADMENFTGAQRQLIKSTFLESANMQEIVCTAGGAGVRRGSWRTLLARPCSLSG